MVPDQRKAQAVKSCLEGEISPMAPASICDNIRIRLCIWIRESASLLSPGLQNRLLEESRVAVSSKTLMATAAKPIPSLRWWIGGLLFASTVINYIDRQTLSLLAPYLKLEYHWTNSDYANIAIAFRVAYSIGQTVFGRLMDRIGTRRGLTLTVICYSIISMLTSLARGFTASPRFGFCWALGSRRTGLPPRRRSRNGFPSESGRWPRRFSTADRPLAERLLPSLFWWIYFRWGWRPALWSRACSAFFG